MAVILVAPSEPGAGATTVAVGLAHRLAYAGHSVRLERLGGDERSSADARTFATLEFADASAQPVEPNSVADSGDAVTIVEAPSGTDPAALARQLAAQLVLVSRPGADAMTAEGLMIENHCRLGGPLRLPEDRLLAAPTVGALIAASHARVLTRSLEGEHAVCEYIVIGAISHDSDQPYFARFPRKAVVTRAEKVDVALSALRTGAECLILTGGSDPSPYLLDRVASTRGTTLLLAPEGTVETVRDIEGTFGGAPFAGEAKVERIGALMADVVDDLTLSRLLSRQ